MKNNEREQLHSWVLRQLRRSSNARGSDGPELRETILKIDRDASSLYQLFESAQSRAADDCEQVSSASRRRWRQLQE